MNIEDKKPNNKQSIFIERYLLHFNASRAAREAGYSEKTANVIGYEILTKPYIKNVIDRRIKETVAQTDEKKACLINFWTAVINDETSSAASKLRASDLLGKYLSMFIDRVEVTGDIQVVKIDDEDDGL